MPQSDAERFLQSTRDNSDCYTCAEKSNTKYCNHGNEESWCCRNDEQSDGCVTDPDNDVLCTYNYRTHGELFFSFCKGISEERCGGEL